MECNLKYKLLEEALRFIEVCQINFQNKVIDRKQFISLTKTKIEFINSFMSREGLVFWDKKIN